MKLKCYASGDGSLSFTWEYKDKALNDEVTETHIKEWLVDHHEYAYMRLVYVNHGWKLLYPITRKSENLLKFESLHDIKYYEYTNNPLVVKEVFGEVTAHLSTIAAIKFFLENENLLK